MITISLLNMKGGVGKTTLAVNLAWNLFRRHHKRVLLVDLDPQFNASQYLMTFDRYESHRKNNGTVADILLDAPLKPVHKGSKHSTQYMYQVERSKQDGGFLYLLPSELRLAIAVKNPQGVEFRLQKILDSWEKYFDYAFIDCAPTDTVLTATALMASNFTLVPISPDRFSVLGYSMMNNVLEKFKSDYPDPKKVQDLGVIFTRVKPDDTSLQEDAKKIIRNEASYVFKTEIQESRSYLRSVHEMSPVFDTRYARELTKHSIDELVKELSARISLLQNTRMGLTP